jgi:SAM-dependent methyltransferase
MGTGWGADDVVAAHATTGFTDPGEEVALEQVAAHGRGRVLDIAMGAGRTTGLLLPSARSYVGVDLAPEMLEVARQRFPGADLRVLDARTLEGLPDASFDLVVLSNNGLDALDHVDRLTALRAMARVVAPEGRVVFSSLNIDGVSFDERPWTPGPLHGGRALRHLLLAVRHPAAWVRSVGAYRRTRRAAEDGPGWARRPLRALGFRFLVHFASLASTVTMARAAGLEPVAGFSERGAPVDVGAAGTTADYVHFVCRRAQVRDPG